MARILLTGLAGLAGVLAVKVGSAVLRLRPVVHEVAEELRSPWLYVPVWAPRRAIGGLDRTVLRLARPLLGRDSPTRAGVALERRRVPVPGQGRSIEVSLYEPSNRPQPSGALFWVHGGGLVAGGPGRDNDLCSLFAAEAGILVVSADYRLAPEHPFPAGLDDCHRALEWLHEMAGPLGVDPNRVAVGGSSAGGGLAAALAQRARDGERLPVAFQLLVYPMLDDRTTMDPESHSRAWIGWTPATNRYGWTSYLAHEPGPEAPADYAVAARRSDLSGLPPAWVGVAGLDLLHDEGVDYAGRLRLAGVRCDLHVEPGMYHAADVQSTAPSMRQFRDRMVEALRAAVGVA